MEQTSYLATLNPALKGKQLNVERVRALLHR